MQASRHVYTASHACALVWPDETHHPLLRASQPGKPLFVSALVYLNGSWPMEHDAETLAVDIDTDTGVFVRPRPGRVVLMDQVSHSPLCPPGRPLLSPRPLVD